MHRAIDEVDPRESIIKFKGLSTQCARRGVVSPHRCALTARLGYDNRLRRMVQMERRPGSSLKTSLFGEMDVDVINGPGAVAVVSDGYATDEQSIQ